LVSQFRSFDQSSSKQVDVKTQMSRDQIDGLFLFSQQVKEKGAYSGLTYDVCDELITRAVTAAAASVGK